MPTLLKTSNLIKLRLVPSYLLSFLNIKRFFLLKNFKREKKKNKQKIRNLNPSLGGILEVDCNLKAKFSAYLTHTIGFNNYVSLNCQFVIKLCI